MTNAMRHSREDIPCQAGLVMAGARTGDQEVMHPISEKT